MEDLKTTERDDPSGSLGEKAIFEQSRRCFDSQTEIGYQDRLVTSNRHLQLKRSTDYYCNKVELR